MTLGYYRVTPMLLQSLFLSCFNNASLVIEVILSSIISSKSAAKQQYNSSMNGNYTVGKSELIEYFIDRYLPREEIIHRLPLSLPIGTFWPELTAERKRRSVELPLYSQKGLPFWFVINKSIEDQCDRIAAFARRKIIFSGPVFDEMEADAVIDEAVYSSIIDGSFTSRKEAKSFIQGKKAPQNKSEQMIRNNYDALTYVLEHLNEPITENTIITIAEIVTRSAAEAQVEGYRSASVYVNGPEGVIYEPPKAEMVPEMMKNLIEFLQNSEFHPILKACIAHFYFVYVHPFADGNGRTVRALSYMMLLQSGYDFFRFFSISNIVAQERGKYYRSILNVEKSEGDMTYFIDAYTDMLARTVQKMEDHLRCHVFAGQKIRELENTGALNERQLKGAKWLLESGLLQITVEAWKKKYKVATETARQDLLLFSEIGLLSRSMEGKKAVFRIIENQ